MTKRRRQGGGKKLAEAKFWGRQELWQTEPEVASEREAGPDREQGPGPGQESGAGPNSEPGAEGARQGPTVTSVRPIVPSADPAVLIRSLGPPPLAVSSDQAERHLTAVYEEAVKAATALAAANGLLAAEDEGG